MTWPPFSGQSLERLARACQFAAHATKPSGDLVQIGDNDSGRFFKLTPWQDGEGNERVLDASHLWRPETLEQAILCALAGSPLSLPEVTSRQDLEPAIARTAAARTATRVIIRPDDPSALAGLDRMAYPDFGLFIWKNSRTFLSVRCGPIGLNGLGAHAHNDQLAVELEIDGLPWARDPGTFVYTPDLVARNAYRSALAHFVPRCGQEEPARLDLGPFRLEDRAQAQALYFNSQGFLGTHQGFADRVWRRVSVQGGVLVVEDCWGGAEIGPETGIITHEVRSCGELAGLWGLSLPFSPGYGRS